MERQALCGFWLRERPRRAPNKVLTLWHRFRVLVFHHLRKMLIDRSFAPIDPLPHFQGLRKTTFFHIAVNARPATARQLCGKGHEVQEFI